ncbi:MAG: efflux RND transporter periplasmic adaptor subunit [Candidatus Zixiibacteriota bacterium]|nr:MAG: efflux RND transporter periplasmic adaptor subunit [candidate division Zixibacteria bacterium]
MKAVTGIGLILATLATFSCSSENPAPGGSGLIEATEILISAEATGRLERLYVDEGSRVTAGDTLGLIDTTTIVLNLNRARAINEAAEIHREMARLGITEAKHNLDLAEKEFSRLGALIKTGSANQQQYDRAENAFNQAQLAKKQADAALQAADAELAGVTAEIALLQDQLQKCYPIAPASGIVVTTFIEAGELATAGKPLIKVAKLDTVWVKVYVPPSDLTAIKLGQTARIDPEDGRQTPLRGTVTHIADKAEFTPKNVQTRQARANLVYAVKITIPNENGELKIGMPVTVQIQ